MTEWIRRFRQNIHSPADLALLVRMGTWLAFEPFLIRFLSLPRLLAWHTPARPLLPPHRRDRLCIFAQFLLSDRMDLFERTCLKRSLLLYRYLHGEPNPPRFQIGVRSENGRLQGHSWVTLGGVPVYPGEDQGYAVTFAYPPAVEKR